MDWPLRVQVAVAPSNHHNFGLAAATSHTLEHLHTWAVAEALRNRTGVVAVGRRVIRRRVVAADILHRTARIHLHTLVAGAGRKGLVRSPLLLHKQERLWSRCEIKWKNGKKDRQNCRGCDTDQSKTSKHSIGKRQHAASVRLEQ